MHDKTVKIQFDIFFLEQKKSFLKKCIFFSFCKKNFGPKKK